jgi:putative membrane-bound dehydrogenase-like protein
VLIFATLALLTLFIGLAVWGIVLVRTSGNWRRRGVGIVLLVQALVALGAQIALSTLPFGIGEPFIRVPFREVLLQAFFTLLAVAGIGILLYIAYRWANQGTTNLSSRLSLIVLLLVLPLLAPAALYGIARVSLPERERERDPLKREVTLQPGFSWSIYAQGTMDNPTTMAFGPDDELYIADISGTLWVAVDEDGDGSTDRITKFADGFSLLVGLIWHDDELFAASSGKIEALRDTDGDGIADQRRLVVDGLPSMILMPHSNNGLAVGPDDRLYFGVGSTTNGRVEHNELAAAILSINPDGNDLRVFARGLGNSFDVAFNAEGELFAGDNSPQGEGTDPPDEFNHIVEGGHYGFPYFYGDPPENGGTRGALVSFPPHSAPTGVTFYSGSAYPTEYYDSGFITLWNRGEIARVEVGRAASGNYLGRTSTFGSGFLYPIDVVTGPDGNLYVADFGTSVIYRITHDPNKAW